ncbi:membrane-associated protein [Curtobacterium luteum]|uniref:Membrane protein n=1 Tax=Curtobacterium luteum TaxID=33881 RepID=A0A8H9GBV9_9MICO|nr:MULTISPECIES: DedA family protein [Curtobacterium]MBM7801323.1 membrane-associated protein [Curtobacterium luteum]NUU50002.1 DedA family protein [Curtobacterium luteum]GGL12681.1 membrane protein [Curtobacterium luteum]
MLSSVPLAVSLFDAASVLHAFGPDVLAGIAVLIFIESGVLFPFLPGDSLLVTAAIISGTLGIAPWQVAIVASVAAVAGDQVGYWLGKRYGRRLFRDDARILTTARLEEAEAFFTRWGGLSLVLGRFVPIVRTYVPLAAGTARMHYRRFLLFNLIGAISWAVGLTVVGVLLGGIPLVSHNIDALMIVIVVVSVLPIVIGALRRRHVARRTRRDEQAGRGVPTDAQARAAAGDER